MSFGRAIRRIESPGPGEKTLYLTFDDGPDPTGTPAVLDRLAELGVPATFFVVAQKAARERALLSRLRAAGHAVGDHSLDHRYGAFFGGRKKMLDWIRDSETRLAELLGESPAGFRPPAGVRTPELHWALRELSVPLVLWDLRFYDTTFAWRAPLALRGLRRARPGAIILLHDRQRASRLPEFLDTLRLFVETARQNGFSFAALSRAQLSLHI